MSTNTLSVIPDDPWHLPRAEDRVVLRSMVRSISDAAQSETESMQPQFFDAGANFEGIRCPQCAGRVGSDWWATTMSADSDMSGFFLREYEMPCCAATVRLNELCYDWHQGFACYGLTLHNADTASALAIADAATSALRQPVQVVIAHV